MYKSKPEDLKTVSQQLGVAKVLEGTVQRAIDKVRVNVQLIDVRTALTCGLKALMEIREIFLPWKVTWHRRWPIHSRRTVASRS